MGGPGPNKGCPCGSGQKFKKCCGPILRGLPARTPEALMRSRYTAYALAEVAHIARTTHPGSPHAGASPEELLDFCHRHEFVGLEVLHAETEGDRGTVSFRAHLTADGAPAPIEENSLFLRVDGRWLYMTDAR